MGKRRWSAAIVIFAVIMVPRVSKADGGEAFITVGATGYLSFLRNPTLTYTKQRPRLNALTPAISGSVGLGATDWLSIAAASRLLLPMDVTDQDTSAQGFPVGETTYRALSLQFPLSVTARYTRGKSTSIGLVIEGGVEFAQWSLLSSTDQSSLKNAFNIAQTSEWSTSWFLGIQPMLEWRHFDHFAFSLGPRFILTTTGSVHVGAGADVTVLWGLGHF